MTSYTKDKIDSIHFASVVDGEVDVDTLILTRGDGTRIEIPIPSGGVTQEDVDASIATAVDELRGAAPEALNQLAELAAALGDDENFAAVVLAQLAAIETSIDNLNVLEFGGNVEYTFVAGDVAHPDSWWGEACVKILDWTPERSGILTFFTCDENGDTHSPTNDNNFEIEFSDPTIPVIGPVPDPQEEELAWDYDPITQDVENLKWVKIVAGRTYKIVLVDYAGADGVGHTIQYNLLAAEMYRLGGLLEVPPAVDGVEYSTLFVEGQQALRPKRSWPQHFMVSASTNPAIQELHAPNNPPENLMLGIDHMSIDNPDYSPVGIEAAPGGGDQIVLPPGVWDIVCNVATKAEANGQGEMYANLWLQGAAFNGNPSELSEIAPDDTGLARAQLTCRARVNPNTVASLQCYVQRGGAQQWRVAECRFTLLRVSPDRNST